MSDTIKMPRPWVPRREDGPQGRVEHDDRGNAIWRRTRASDAPALATAESLSLAEDPPRATRGGLRKAQVSYFEHAGPGESAPRRPKDLRALSRWIEARRAGPVDDEE